MRKTFNIVLSIILVMAFVITSAGCTATPEKSTTTTNTASTETTSKPESETKQIEITWLGPGSSTVKDENYVQQKIEKLFNVKIINKKIDINNSQQGSLMVASGDFPDVAVSPTVSENADGNSPLAIYRQGVIRTIPKSLIEKDAPNYFKMISSDPVGLKINLVPVNLIPDKPDEYLSLTGYIGYGNSFSFVPHYRLDWLEKLGFKPNGELKQLDKDGRVFWSTKGFTLDQAQQIFTAFVKNDPDGNSKNDTFAFTSNGFSGYEPFNFSSIIGAFGLGFDKNIIENGELVMYNISTKYKEFLKLMNQWYNEGIIDKEWATTNWNNWSEKLADNKGGYWSTPYFYLDPGLKDRPPWVILNKNPNSKIVIMPPEVGADGSYGGKKVTDTPFTYNTYIGKGVSDEKLERILQIIDYVSFDKEGSTWSMYGEAGVHFDWAGEPNNSQPIFKKDVPAMGGEFGFQTYTISIITNDMLKYFFGSEVSQLATELNSGDFPKHAIHDAKLDLFNVTKVADVRKEVGGGPNTIANEFFAKAVSGKISIDKEWDNYVKQWKDAGGAKILEELAKAPNYEDLGK